MLKKKVAASLGNADATIIIIINSSLFVPMGELKNILDVNIQNNSFLFLFPFAFGC